jgi:CO/xanthine dehydrogenase Mo-binding subunit
MPRDQIDGATTSAASAIANALFAASGLRVRSLPLLPDGVLAQVADASPI